MSDFTEYNTGNTPYDNTGNKSIDDTNLNTDDNVIDIAEHIEPPEWERELNDVIYYCEVGKTVLAVLIAQAEAKVEVGSTAEQQLSHCHLATLNGKPVDNWQQKYHAAIKTLGEMTELLNAPNLNQTLNQLSGLHKMIEHMQDQSQTIVELVLKDKG